MLLCRSISRWIILFGENPRHSRIKGQLLYEEQLSRRLPRVIFVTNRRYRPIHTVLTARKVAENLASDAYFAPPTRTREKWSRLEMRCELSFVLSRPSFQFATVQCQICWGLLKTVLTCRQFSSQHRHGQDNVVLFCRLCRRCELGITEYAIVVEKLHNSFWLSKQGAWALSSTWRNAFLFGSQIILPVLYFFYVLCRLHSVLCWFLSATTLALL